jgi:energy-coupling factor transport system ATP-binding protein
MAPSSKNEFPLEVENLKLAFKQRSVLDDFNLKVKPGECLGIVGRNGSGKTSLALYLAGVIPDFIDASVSGEKKAESRPGLVMQNPSAQFFALTVKEELKDENGVKEFGLNELWERSVFDLSEGEKQKINLVNNWLQGREIILLDEPLELLDPFEQQRFLKVLEKLKGEGKTILWFDKDEKFMGLADRKVYLSPQRKARSGKKSGKKTEETVLKADFTLKLGEFCLKEAKLELKKGEKVALVGRNGAGKTLFLKALAGLQKVEGKVECLERKSLALQNPCHQFYQDSVDEEIEVKENVSRLGLQDILRDDPSRLSKGQKKMVAIASTGKGLVLLDEPTTWLDPENKEKVYQFIEDSRESMVIATHDPELLGCCDRVLMVNGGLKECSSTQIKQFFQGRLKA